MGFHKDNADGAKEIRQLPPADIRLQLLYTDPFLDSRYKLGQIHLSLCVIRCRL